MQRPGIPRRPRDDDDAQREGPDEEDADHRVLLETPVLRDDRHEDRGSQPGDGAAQQQRPLHEEGHGQPGKHRVGNGVTDERHPAQNDVRTDDPGDYRAHQGDEQRLRQKTQQGIGEVGQEVERGEHDHLRSGGICADDSQQRRRARDPEGLHSHGRVAQLLGGRVGDDSPIDQAHSVGRGHRLGQVVGRHDEGRPGP